MGMSKGFINHPKIASPESTSQHWKKLSKAWILKVSAQLAGCWRSDMISPQEFLLLIRL